MWRKQGCIFVPSGELWWSRTYAMLPTVARLDDSTLRVYFDSLDSQQFGRIGYVDVDAADPRRVVAVGKEPVLDLGESGLFDDSGVNPSCVVDVDGSRYLYYIGWQRCERVPYMLFPGLAISRNGGPFEKYARVPVLDRTTLEPYMRTAPVVLHDEGRFRMWYTSGVGWMPVGNTLYPRYVVRHAESSDGLVWRGCEDICIDFQAADETGFGRPWVVKDPDCYRMWYSIRYLTSDNRIAYRRIGYAESPDGSTWERRDDVGSIELSTEGWDSGMVCFPCVVDVKGRRYMFYNGDRHGQTGFGFAVWEPE